MGGNAASLLPMIADLYLSCFEYKFLTKLIKNENFSLVQKLKYNFSLYR